jgi:hypothetical protein
MLLHSIIKNTIMKKQTKEYTDSKPDLKHDTMEFSAATEGEDKLDTDDTAYEEEEILPDELDILQDEPDNEAAALDAAETDRLVDEDNLPEEEWTDDIEDEEEDDNEEHHRTKII